MIVSILRDEFSGISNCAKKEQKANIEQVYVQLVKSQ